ncbi:MAG: DUF3347 domain-containing protein [Pedobacter sp.]|nr:DUF3347 domain-containing protein [Pedobacter sp.]
MKLTILSMAVSILLFTACNNGSKTTNNSVGGIDSAKTEVAHTEADIRTASTKEVISAYLQLKNALAKDNDKDAAEGGNNLVKAIGNVDQASLTVQQSKVFKDISDDAKEHAEHIGSNAGNIKHQREHFEMLSPEIYELVKAGDKTGQKFYYVNCPMYNGGKGGNWISETKDIQNPYLGKAMLNCGSIKEELN